MVVATPMISNRIIIDLIPMLDLLDARTLARTVLRDGTQDTPLSLLRSLHQGMLESQSYLRLFLADGSRLSPVDIHVVLHEVNNNIA
jgi:hypothetical protein